LKLQAPKETHQFPVCDRTSAPLDYWEIGAWWAQEESHQSQWHRGPRVICRIFRLPGFVPTTNASDCPVAGYAQIKVPHCAEAAVDRKASSNRDLHPMNSPSSWLPCRPGQTGT